MKYISLLALIALPILAQPTNVRVIRATHQQIVLGYNAPAGDDCTIELSESSSYSPVVKDVNGTLFSGASSDLSRASTFVSGTRRMVVIGARAVDKASDGRRYSRSLQQNTAHYGRLTNCGGTATFTVSTPVQPYGQVMDAYTTHPDTGMDGYYNFPSIDITDRTETIVDPYTGQLLRKVQLPGDMVDTNELTAITGTASGASWTNPTNVTATADAAVASYSGTGQAILFVPNGTFLENNNNRNFIHRLELDVTARITGGATGEDAKLQVCMGTATACDSPWQDFTVSTSTLAKTIIGDDEAQSNWYTNSEYVTEQWWCSTCGVGYRIRPKTTNAAYTTEIDSVVARYKTGVTYNSSSSQYQMWSPLTLTEAADGKTYRLAYFEDRAGAGNPALYSIATDGTAHFMGTMHASTGIPTGSVNWAFVQIVFDRQDGHIMYGLSTTGVLVKIVLSSASGTLSTDAAVVDRDTGQSSKLTFTAMTATGYTIDDQVQAFNPLFTAEWITKSTWTLQLDQDGKMVLKSLVNQDRGMFIAVFDPLATPPVGCATCIGSIIAAAPFGASANGPQCTKFCTVHAISTGQQAGWISVGVARRTTAGDGSYHYGPWRIQVKKPSCDIPTQDCSITTGMTTFEIVPVSGNYDFVDPAPGGTEDASMPLAVGDLVMYVGSPNVDLQWRTNDEYMEITAVDTVAHTITVRRGTNILTSDWANSNFASDPNNITNTAQTIAEGAFLYGICRFVPVNQIHLGDFAWNYVASPKGDTVVYPIRNGVGTYPPSAGIYPESSGYASPIVGHYINSGNHGEWGVVGNQTFTADANDVWCSWFYSNSDSCYNMQISSNGINTLTSPVARNLIYTGFFGGKDPVYGSSYQSHPRQAQQFADGSPNSADKSAGRMREWMADVKPFVSPTATVTLTAVGGTSNVWKYSGPTLERKHYPTMAFSGNRVLRDVSGPGSVIDDTKPWSYCVALLANECVTGSSVGDIYANSPLKNYAGCYTSSTSNTNWNSNPTNTWGICIEDTPAFVFGPVQIELTKDDFDGQWARTLNMVPFKPGLQTIFAVAFASGDGKQVTTLAEWGGWASFWLINGAGDMPAPSNTLGNTFDRVKVDLYHATAAKFRIEFGYREVASETSYQCTTRAETCVVDSATVADATPFKFASETLSYISCSSGRCQAEIPRRPGRVVFSRAKFYNSGGTLLETRVLPPQ